ncbi:MAG TPA: PEP-CTERM sorting domain-containing protein [Acetobacteraceae bacterium]|jgi:hypothetical protein|nr:PEP-CTERM sorting domain-containing protein [Acetobacteraceae bacterium]
MRLFLSATAAIIACGSASLPALAQGNDAVTFTAIGTDGSGNPEVSISGSFLIFATPDSVQDSDNWDGVSDFSVSFTGLAGDPNATFTSTNLPTTLAPATEYGGPFYMFDYNTFGPFPGLPIMFDIGANGLDSLGNNYGFSIQDTDPPGTFSYAVAGTEYSGDLEDINVNDPAAAPEPASLAVLGIGLAGLAAARRRRRRAV